MELIQFRKKVALLLIERLSTEEITAVRETKLVTIKSQSNAIYRKAELKSRNKLSAYFIEDLLAGDQLITQ
ncbi:MAG: hypothetical protein OSA23_12490 [Rhodospirillales bacterium]|nr:hypothetical protein [Rhodospirillales bacterium]